MHTIVITGGAGFIGNHVVRRFVREYPDYHIICLDVLTYAGNLANLADVENAPNYEFARLDICDYAAVRRLFEEKHVDGIIHLAAESHVDRSIKDPMAFARTNVMGTLSLLQAARDYWESLPERYEGKRFYHISTDEVYGALDITRPGDTAPYGDDFFVETTPYRPHSPYSASKASSDHFVRAYHDTYGMRRSSATARTITAPTSSPRSSSRCSSTTSATAVPSPSMAKAKTYATGSMWWTTLAPSTSSITKEPSPTPII